MNRKPGTFTKGDSRINRRGRPKNFDAFRSLAQQIAVEDAPVSDDVAISRAENILRGWATSKSFDEQKYFMEVAYGKVPQVTEISGKDGEALLIKLDK